MKKKYSKPTAFAQTIEEEEIIASSPLTINYKKSETADDSFGALSKRHRDSWSNGWDD